jgi:hypothetical protein
MGSHIESFQKPSPITYFNMEHPVQFSHTSWWDCHGVLVIAVPPRLLHSFSNVISIDDQLVALKPGNNINDDVLAFDMMKSDGFFDGWYVSFGIFFVYSFNQLNNSAKQGATTINIYFAFVPFLNGNHLDDGTLFIWKTITILVF